MKTKEETAAVKKGVVLSSPRGDYCQNFGMAQGEPRCETAIQTHSAWRGECYGGKEDCSL